MKVTIDENSGFCFGVTTAIETAERELQKGPLFCLGDIVHNGQEVERLDRLGLETIDYDDLRTLHNVRVLLRAHGEPPSTYHIAKRNNIEIIDASCPVVLHLQKRIRNTYLQHHGTDAQIVIFGKKGHAEVIGLEGQTNNTAIVIESIHDVDKLDFSRPIYLFSQTTKDPHQFQELGESLRSAVISASGDDTQLSVFNTICRQVSSRHPNLIEFAKGHSIIIFVCGKESSNGKILSQLCKSVNPRTYSVEHHQEIDPDWFAEGDFIGICGATSTPKWQLEEVANYLKNL
jgi:4-hydroxy-3-methylbut-2-enyl diphosphate reductase